MQRDNPEMERRCREVIDRCWQLGEHNPIKFIHDVGAGGLSNAFPELVNDGGRGGRFELRNIPNDEPGMAPLEIWCNESRGRYVLSVDAADFERFKAICERERCPFAVVGEATEEPHLTVADSHFGNKPVDMPLNVLLGKAPRMHRTASREAELGDDFSAASVDLAEAVTRVLRHPAVASKSFLITIGDRSITGQVARDQMVGPWQVPVADCAVTATSYDVYTGEAMAMGERTPLALLDAPASGRMAIGETLTNLAAARIEKISDIKLSANWMAAAGHPGEDARLYDTVRAVGMELCPQLGITVPVGKDFDVDEDALVGGGEKSVTSPLSLIVSGFAPVADIRQTLTPQLRADKGATDLIWSIWAVVRTAWVPRSSLRCTARSAVRRPTSMTPRICRPSSPWSGPECRRSAAGLSRPLRRWSADHRAGDGLRRSLWLEPESRRPAGQRRRHRRLALQRGLGAVLRAQDDTEIVLAQFSAAGLGDCVAVIGQPVNNGHVSIRHGENKCSLASAVCCSASGPRPATRSSVCATTPSAPTGVRCTAGRGQPGLSAKLSFDVNEDIAAPFIKRGVRPCGGAARAGRQRRWRWPPRSIAPASQRSTCT